MPWLLFPAMGCAPMGTPHPLEEDEKPSIDGTVLVDPGVIDFGVFDLPKEPGDLEFLTASFTVRNAGAEATIVHGQSDVVGSDAFAVKVPSDPDTLAGHEVVEYTVVFQPLVDDEYTGEVSLNFGDAVVRFEGIAHAPRLSVDEEIDISTPVGCLGEHLLRVENIGHDDLELDPNDFSEAGPKYGVSWSSEAEPFTLEPGEVTELALTFEPDSLVVDELIEARIATNEPGAPIRTIAINANAPLAPATTESFEFETDFQASLLIVPDTREAMAPTLEAFAAKAGALVAALASEGNDVNVAVVGGFGDVPCPTSEIRYTTLDPKAAAVGIAEGLLAAGASTGNLLALAQGAVYEMAPNGCLAGFLRPATSLHVLLLSDGSEDSYSDPSTYAKAIANEVTALGGSGSSLSVFVPGGEDCTDEGCVRLIEATEDLNGTVWDLSTTDWNETVEAYGASLVPLHATLPLVLSQRAQESQIEVWADGSEIDADPYWSYNSGPQAVMLRTDAPIAAGATVDVRYLPAAICD